ncbi:MAG: hypothetical protein HS105_00020 [Chloracidobacterium sp.]|nr:hypothetical protein [Chloracidobacterium sp.]MCO5333434.1 hypothetical protein [Pyrinomonadaceae bacterium]
MKNLKGIFKKTLSISWLGMVFGIFILCSLAKGQTDNFNDRPWLNEKYPLIVDISSQKDVTNSFRQINLESIFKEKKVAGITAMVSRDLHKYASFQTHAAINAGRMRFASFHVGTSGEPIQQANYYLKVRGDKSQPTGLRIENTDRTNMTLSNAEKFIKRVFDVTGKYPFLYVNKKVFEEINSKYDNTSIFAKCFLWFVATGDSLPKLDKKVWNKVSFWEFANEENCQVCIQKDASGKCTSQQYTTTCPYKITDIKSPVSFSVFNGTKDELQQIWLPSRRPTYENMVGDLDGYIQKAFVKSAKTQRQLVGKNFPCNLGDVFFVEGFDKNGKLVERYLVSNKDSSYSKSNNFIKWGAGYFQVSYEHQPEYKESNEESEIDLNILTIKSLGGGKFRFINRYIYESKEPEKELTGNAELNLSEFLTQSNCGWK